MRVFRSSLIVLAAVLPWLAGCVERQVVVDRGTPVVVAQPPPAARVEVIPAAPGPPEAWVWQPGHWRWDGREYVWIPGRYAGRPHRVAQWVPPHWEPRPGGYAFIEGHWR
jgi:hypothetical protein